MLCNGLTFEDLAAVLEGLKESSKSVGTHKRRSLLWDAYSAFLSKTTGRDGRAECFLTYAAAGADGDGGGCDVVELTKRQRGLLNSVDIVGKKLKPEDPAAKGWCVAWSEDDAQRAFDDLMRAEPCIYLTGQGLYVATRFKRVLCKKFSAPVKKLSDVEKIFASDASLRSVSFVGNEPPTPNGYNIILAGPHGALAKELAAASHPTLALCEGTSPGDIYDCFALRRSAHLLSEAEKLIAQMLVDVQRDLVPLVVAGSMKDAAAARKNALIKPVFVHESKRKFIEQARAAGDVDMAVISGPVDALEESEFWKYGGIVFEMFYRVDLTNFV